MRAFEYAMQVLLNAYHFLGFLYTVLFLLGLFIGICLLCNDGVYIHYGLAILIVCIFFVVVIHRGVCSIMNISYT